MYPRNDLIFYVGKASSNNRAFEHLKTRDEKGLRGSKNALIDEIKNSGFKPRVDIIRHGLADADTAFEVEAAVIDVLGLENLTNEVSGHNIERGYQSSDTLSRLYGAEEITVSELETNAIVFYLNTSYYPQINAQELYDSTRQYWRVSLQKVNSHDDEGNLLYPLALAVVNGIIVAAYDIVQWFEAGTTFSKRTLERNDKIKHLRKELEQDEIEPTRKAEFIGMPSTKYEYLYKKLLDENGKPLVAKQNGFEYFQVS
jgi:hypothetical protein